MDRLAVNPSALKDARASGYNHGIIAAGTFYSAGQVPMDAASNVVGEDITTQARKVYDNVAVLLDTVGKALEDVAKVTTNIVDLADNYRDGYEDVYRESFTEPYPCHTALGVDQLAREAYLVEVEVEVPFSARDVENIEPDGDEI
jgi:enamine deaminase RidA (YjgF/YER057c/UK114 family)